MTLTVPAAVEVFLAAPGAVLTDGTAVVVDPERRQHENSDRAEKTHEREQPVRHDLQGQVSTDSAVLKRNAAERNAGSGWKQRQGNFGLGLRNPAQSCAPCCLKLPRVGTSSFLSQVKKQSFTKKRPCSEVLTEHVDWLLVLSPIPPVIIN